MSKRRRTLTNKQRDAARTWYADLRNFRYDATAAPCFFCQSTIKNVGERYHSPHYQIGACKQCRRQFNRVRYYMRGASPEQLDKVVWIILEMAMKHGKLWRDEAKGFADAAAENARLDSA